MKNTFCSMPGLTYLADLVSAMKHSEAPVCPRCNRNDEVHKVLHEPVAHHPATPVREGYILEGIVIRPDSSDWYCSSCSEMFAAARVYWGKFLTDRPQ